MSSESGDERRSESKAGRAAAKPSESELQQCPRCESPNTKFCYYNNYNLSQPRYFCKACRRYWTQGGTLRNIPVGGGTRRSSFYKRVRTTPTTTANTTTTSHVQDSLPVSVVSDMNHGSASYLSCDMNLNEAALPETGSFSSLLTTRVGNGFMSWPGYGLGLELGQGLHGVGYGLGLLDWPMEPLSQGNGVGAVAGGGGNEGVSGYNTWQMGGGFEAGLARADCFGWPNLKAEKPHLY